MGQTGSEQSQQAAQELSNFDDSAVVNFATNQPNSPSAIEILSDIGALLTDAIEAQLRIASSDFDDHLRNSRTKKPSLMKEIDSRAGSAALDIQERLFLSAFQANKGIMEWRASRGDEAMTHALFFYEFSGHPKARHYRKVLAETRAMLAFSGEAPVEYFGESLRLLRHSGEIKSLAAMANRLDERGPLQILRSETLQAARGWAREAQPDDATLSLLQIGAPTLDPHEALQAYTRLSQIRNEPPLQRGLAWTSQGFRFEKIWRALFELSKTAGHVDHAIILYLNDLRDFSQDDLDPFSARVLPEKSSLSDSSREALGAWLSSAYSASYPLTSGTIIDRIHPPASVFLPDGATLEDIRRCLNAANVNKVALGSSQIRQIEAVLRDALAETRTQAARGVHQMGGPIPASLAVGALQLGADLADDLADVLVDSNVHRVQRADALDRLAWLPHEVPKRLLDRLQGQASNLLSGSPGFGDSAIQPFPEALRALGSLSLATEGELQILVSQLLGSSDPAARAEGIHTIRCWILAGRSDTWIEPLVTLYSHSTDDTVRGIAGNALCWLAANRSTPHFGSESRILQMLHEDGSLIPRQVLNGVRQNLSFATPPLVARVRAMATQHAHREVRLLASEVLKEIQG